MQQQEEPPPKSIVVFRDGHYEVPHPTVFPLRCEPCAQDIKAAAFKRDLLRHSKKCRQVPPDTTVSNVFFKCESCEHLATDRRKATTHQATHFGDPSLQIVTYPCSFCNQTFATQKAASSHRNQCSHRPPPARTEAESVIPMQAATSTSDEAPVEEDTIEAESGMPVQAETSVEDDTNIAVEDDGPPASPRPASPVYPPLSYSPISATSLPEEPSEEYELPAAIANFDCDEWLSSILPPKPKRKSHKPHVSTDPRMTPEELQKLYTKSMKKALMKINFTPEIECKVPREEIFDQMSAQLKARNIEMPTNLWNPCLDGLEDLSRPFTEAEIREALKHADSAAGPDGWTYSEVAKQPDFHKKFLEGLHQIAATGKTPDAWRHYNSLMLFKKPDDYRQGQECEVKCFRPIALLNVSYKLLTSMLCKRMSKWLERNNGISFGQRAAFSRRGVQENTLIVLEALKQKKTVVYLDLSDAFNSVDHNLILEALKQSRCPRWITELVKSLYVNCTTTPINTMGCPLCDPVEVNQGVRQGCPLSALLFNLVLDPLLKSATTESSFGLGYMDDIAVINDDDNKTPEIVDSMKTRADSLGLSFNAKKCGAANSSHDLSINEVAIPKVSDERAYKYLGTDAFTSTLGGIERCFNEAWAQAQRIEVSDLTPMQKLHALRTKIVPMLYHLLENSQCKQKDLHRINRSLRRMVKRLCYLPERAANAYVHLHRLYGGPGIPDLIIVKAQMTMRSLTRAMNQADEFGQRTRQLLLRGKSEEEFIGAINNRSRRGLSELGKEVIMAVGRLERFLNCTFSMERRGDYIGWSMDGSFYKDLGATLTTAVQKRGLSLLKACPNQGRFWSTLPMCPATTRTLYSFHTKMCDWRFAHSARLNLTPVRGSFSWKRADEQNCRRCQTSKETVNHVLNSCYHSRRDVIKRHNDVRDAFVAAVPRSLTVAKEQRFGNLQPDIVVQDNQTRKAWIVDVKVSTEAADSFEEKERTMAEQYDPLRRAFNSQGYQTTVHTLQFGALGGFSRSSIRLLSKIFTSKRKISATLRKMTAIVVHSSRNMMVQHLTGIRQQE